MSPCLKPAGSASRSGRGRVISATTERFEETGEWPTLKWVQRELVGWRDDTDARREASRLPPSLGEVDGDQIILSIRAIYEAEPASVVLENFRTALREAAKRYRRHDRKEAATLSTHELVERSAMSAPQAQQAMKMLAVERLVTGDAEEGRWVITPRIRHYLKAGSVTDYLRKKGHFERRRCWRGIFTKPIALIRAAFTSEGSRQVLFAVVATLLAALLIWVGGKLFPTGGDSNEGHPSGQPARELRSPAANPTD